MISPAERPFESFEDALKVLLSTEHGTPLHGRAFCFCYEQAPPEIRARLDKLSRETFSDLKPSYVEDDGEPMYDVPTMAAYFGCTEAEIVEASKFLPEAFVRDVPAHRIH